MFFPRRLCPLPLLIGLCLQAASPLSSPASAPPRPPPPSPRLAPWGVLRLRGAGPGDLLPETRPEQVEAYDGNPAHCRCPAGCTCPHCQKNTQFDFVLKHDGIPVIQTWRPDPGGDVFTQSDAVACPAGIERLTVPDDWPNVTEAVFATREAGGVVYEGAGDRSVLVRAGRYKWEDDTENGHPVGHWFKIGRRRVHVEGEWGAGAGGQKELRTLLSGGWFLTYRSVGSLSRLVLQKERGGPLIVCMNGNWTLDECRLRVRPGPHVGGRFPQAGMWLGGNVVYADRCAEVLVRRCHIGLMVHRVRIALYQGVCGEATAKVTVEDSRIEHMTHGVMFGENATGVVRRCTLVGCRVGVAVNGSATVTVTHSTVGPNVLGGFCSNWGSEGAVLRVAHNEIVGGEFWYNVFRPGTVIGWAPPGPKRVRVPRWRKFINDSDYIADHAVAARVAGGTGGPGAVREGIEALLEGREAGLLCPTVGPADDAGADDAPYVFREMGFAGA